MDDLYGYNIIKKGDIFWVNFGKKESIIGREQCGIRPAVVIQNNTGNNYSDIVIVAALTAADNDKPELPINLLIERNEQNGLEKDSIVMFNQIRSMDKARLHGRIGRVSLEELNAINKHLLVSFGIDMIHLL